MFASLCPFAVFSFIEIVCEAYWCWTGLKALRGWCGKGTNIKFGGAGRCGVPLNISEISGAGRVREGMVPFTLYTCELTCQWLYLTCCRDCSRSPPLLRFLWTQGTCMEWCCCSILVSLFHIAAEVGVPARVLLRPQLSERRFATLCALYTKHNCTEVRVNNRGCT